MIIGENERTIPSTLRDAGYSTAVIGKWHIGLGSGQVDWNSEISPCPLDVGFDTSYVMAATNDRVPCVYVNGRSVDGLDPDDPISVVYQIIRNHAQVTGDPAVKISTILPMVLSRGRTREDLDHCIEEYEALNVWFVDDARTMIRFIDSES